MERLLILNPGSTSTKLAVFDGEEPLFVESITHSAEELAPFDCVADQYEFRRELVLDCLKRHSVPLDSLTAIVSRGGLLTPIEAGAYEVNDDMVWQLKNKPQNEHASNVGAMIARSISLQLGIPAYIYDGVTVDELLPINKLTGLPSMRRKGMGHNLNTRAAALRYARENGRDYKDITVIVAHLGGGISVNLHHNGKIEDFINDEEGPFSPERAGGLPMFDVIKECFSGRYDYKGMMKLVKNQGGLMAHLGTTDSRAVEQMIQSGDAHAKLVYDAMILNIAKNIAKCAPNVCGKVDAILLTGGIDLPESMQKLMEGWTGIPVPILSVKGATYDTCQELLKLHGKISPEDYRKITVALDAFSEGVDKETLVNKIFNFRSDRVTPMMFEFNLAEQAQKHRMRIVLPEGEELRILRAAESLCERGIADIILLGDTDAIQEKIKKFGLKLQDATIIQPTASPRFNAYAQQYYEMRKSKGLTLEQAQERMQDSTYFGTMMVQIGDADGMVSGAVNTTAHTIRPAFEIIKTKPDTSIVSSVFFMCLKDRILVFGDCAVNPNPTASQLADIAISSAHTARVFGVEPRVAMLSYSTGSSGKGEAVDEVIEATKLAHERAPELLLDGPIQYDAAIDPEVARTKAPTSPVAGHASAPPTRLPSAPSCRASTSP